ncbi:MAG: hypothetical protein PVG09_02355, partial [Thiohalocapsa sp.]
ASAAFGLRRQLPAGVGARQWHRPDRLVAGWPGLGTGALRAELDAAIDALERRIERLQGG